MLFEEILDILVCLCLFELGKSFVTYTEKAGSLVHSPHGGLQASNFNFQAPLGLYESHDPYCGGRQVSEKKLRSDSKIINVDSSVAVCDVAHRSHQIKTDRSFCMGEKNQNRNCSCRAELYQLMQLSRLLFFDTKKLQGF
jgi:hypothetical protein